MTPLEMFNFFNKSDEDTLNFICALLCRDIGHHTLSFYKKVKIDHSTHSTTAGGPLFFLFKYVIRLLMYFCQALQRCKLDTLNILEHPPVLHNLSDIKLPHVDQYLVAHDVPVYQVKKQGTGVIKMELVFNAGRPYEHKKLVATTCGSLLRESTKSFTADEIAEQIDFYGASISSAASLDTITIKVVALQKHFQEIMPILTSILTEPLFLQEELDIRVNRLAEKIKIDQQKNDVKAYRKITELMYGEDHPYGYNSSEELYRLLTTDDLKKHYKDKLHRGALKIFLAGDIDELDKKAIDRMVSQLPAPSTAEQLIITPPEYPPKDRRITLSGTGPQAHIRLARPLFSRDHPDFYAMDFVITLLGGFFGSRLVTTVREELGLTYSIYAMPDMQLHGGSLMIATDVADSNVDICLKAIYSEMERLSQELVSPSEMKLIKNYLAGNLINLFDGPFNSIRVIKTLVLSQFQLDDIQNIIQKSQSITSQQVIDYAERYLNRNDFWEVVVSAS